MARAFPATCPCDSARQYAECCGRWHQGAPAPDAESLMRSRYSAFALELADYLLATWHPTTRPQDLDFDARDEMRPRTIWLGLAIKSRRETGDDSAEVEFIARCRIGGRRAERLHERSRFVREGGSWYYVDGLLNP